MHELSAAVHISAPVFNTQRTLSASIADEVSGFLMAKVPPNPQHSSLLGNSTKSIPPTFLSKRSGASPTRNKRKE
jgi:hypothetical protein